MRPSKHLGDSFSGRTTLSRYKSTGKCVFCTSPKDRRANGRTDPQKCEDASQTCNCSYHLCSVSQTLHLRLIIVQQQVTHTGSVTVLLRGLEFDIPFGFLLTNYLLSCLSIISFTKSHAFALALGLEKKTEKKMEMVRKYLIDIQHGKFKDR